MSNKKPIDYTAMPLGTKIHGHEIELCPKCGRNGLAPPGKNGTTNYLHRLGAIADLSGSGEKTVLTLNLQEDECDVVPEVLEQPPQE